MQYSHVITDLSQDDALEREGVALSIAEEIFSQDEDRPAIISVYGSWGAGKTFVLSRAIRETLKRNGESETVRVIVAPFLAWKYEMEGDLAPGLIRALLEIPTEFRSGDDTFRNLPFRPKERDHVKDLGWGLAELIFDVAPDLVPGGGAVTTLLTVLVKSGKWLAEKRDEAMKTKAARVEEQRPKIDDVKDKMREFVRAILDTAKAEDPDGEKFTYRLAVFVDDLDRCSPENMVSMFEWLKNHLDVEDCVYVMGLDHHAAARAIVGRYRDYISQDEDVAYGYRYLEKLVDSEYELEPAPGVEAMAVRRVCDALNDGQKYPRPRLSDLARELIKKDFPGQQNIDALMDLRGLCTPRTMLKIAWKYERALALLTNDGESGSVQEKARRERAITKLPDTYPFWLAFLTAMYYRLKPEELGDFVRGAGNLFPLIKRGVEAKEEIEATFDFSKREFYSFCRRLREDANLPLLTERQFRFLLTLVRESILPDPETLD